MSEEEEEVGGASNSSASGGESSSSSRSKGIQPKVVLYCGVCGLPPEYCEFGPEFEKCLHWLRQHSPHTYPHLTGAEAGSEEAQRKAGAEAGVQALSIEGAPAAPGQAGEAREGAGAKQPQAARVPKKKKEERAEVVVEKVTRNKRKSITSIRGLESFGVKLGDAAKKLGKKFACGASVTKGVTEKEQIDVQGDIIVDIADYLTDTWPEIPRTSIFLVEDGKKVQAY